MKMLLLQKRAAIIVASICALALEGCAIIDANHTGAMDAIAAWKPKADFIAKDGPIEKQARYNTAKVAVNAYIDDLQRRLTATANWPLGQLDISTPPPALTAQVNAVIGDQAGAVLPIIELLLAILQENQHVRARQAVAVNAQLTQWRWGEWRAATRSDTTSASTLP